MRERVNNWRDRLELAWRLRYRDRLERAWYTVYDLFTSGSTLSRLGFWTFIALLITAIVCVALFTKLSAEAQSSIWVAVGTLALAFVTYWSVSQTRAVISAEDRRHMQQFVPYLQIKDAKQQNRHVVLVIENEGSGLASRIHISFGECKVVTIKPAAGQPTMIQSDIRTIERGFVIYPGIPASKTRHVSLFTFEDNIERVEVGDVYLAYWDMFGNLYETSYTAWTKDREDYTWRQPTALKPRHTEPLEVFAPPPVSNAVDDV